MQVASDLLSGKGYLHHGIAYDHSQPVHFIVTCKSS
jgi:hypothetical protein